MSPDDEHKPDIPDPPGIVDPASQEYWRERSYPGRPPWRRWYRWGDFAVSLALPALIAGLARLLSHAA